MARLSSAVRLVFGAVLNDLRAALVRPYNPQRATTAVSHARRVWAVPLSLATTQGILSFPAGTKMFQFPAFPPLVYVFNQQYPGFPWVGFPIRISPALRLHTAPRGFSQCTTSFFGFCCLGIHLTLLVTSTYVIWRS